MFALRQRDSADVHAEQSGNKSQRYKDCRQYGQHIHVFLRLFAPFLPFITEEVWQWHCAGQFGVKSVHKAAWPKSDEMKDAKPGDIAVYETAKKVLESVRIQKAAQKRSVKWPVSALKVQADKATIKALEAALSDVLIAGCIDRKGLAITEKDDGAELTAEAVLGEA